MKTVIGLTCAAALLTALPAFAEEAEVGLGIAHNGGSNVLQGELDLGRLGLQGALGRPDDATPGSIDLQAGSRLYLSPDHITPYVGLLWTHEEFPSASPGVNPSAFDYLGPTLGVRLKSRTHFGIYGEVQMLRGPRATGGVGGGYVDQWLPSWGVGIQYLFR